MDTATSIITNEAHPDANIIWGATVDPKLEDEMRVTVIATGFTSTTRASQNDTVSTAAPKAAVSHPVAEPAPAPEVKKAETPAEESDAVEDDFTALMNMLNKGKK